MADLTKKEIKATFLRLLDERPYNQITVKDIVRECGINRNTFYYHFADLPALVETVIDEEIGRFVREQISFSSMEESITEALSFFRAHRRASYHVYNSVNRDIFDRYLMKNCESVGAGYVNSLLENNAIKLEVTETAYTENANQVIQVVNTLRQRGFQIEMDDFGTGYSSLNMLTCPLTF